MFSSRILSPVTEDQREIAGRRREMGAPSSPLSEASMASRTSSRNGGMRYSSSSRRESAAGIGPAAFSADAGRERIGQDAAAEDEELFPRILCGEELQGIGLWGAAHGGAGGDRPAGASDLDPQQQQEQSPNPGSAMGSVSRSFLMRAVMSSSGGGGGNGGSKADAGGDLRMASSSSPMSGMEISPVHIRKGSGSSSVLGSRQMGRSMEMLNVSPKAKYPDEPCRRNLFGGVSARVSPKGNSPKVSEGAKADFGVGAAPSIRSAAGPFASANLFGGGGSHWSKRPAKPAASGNPMIRDLKMQSRTRRTYSEGSMAFASSGASGNAKFSSFGRRGSGMDTKQSMAEYASSQLGGSAFSKHLGDTEFTALHAATGEKIAVPEPQEAHIGSFSGKNDAIPRVDASIVKKLVEGSHAEYFDKVCIIDSRFKYEYEGGHIRNAESIMYPEDLLSRFFSEEALRDCARTAIVFHCEFSSHRGPRLALHMREKDRALNTYPDLYYPHVYILEGGYKQFFHEAKDYCEPQAYIQMNDTRYLDELRRFMSSSRMTWRRYKSFTDNFMNSDLNNFADDDSPWDISSGAVDIHDKNVMLNSQNQIFLSEKAAQQWPAKRRKSEVEPFLHDEGAAASATATDAAALHPYTDGASGSSPPAMGGMVG